MDEKKHAGGNLRYIRGRIVMRLPCKDWPGLPGMTASCNYWITICDINGVLLHRG